MQVAVVDSLSLTWTADEIGARMHRTKVKIVEEALDANNTIARANRDDFDRAGVSVINLMSAPGAGKTTLLERVLTGLSDEGVRVGVLEGDVQGSFDADRLAGLHIPVTQLNTANGFGGECHLDANMVRAALGALPLTELDLLIIENVGNLVCPAEFSVGADARTMVCSVTATKMRVSAQRRGRRCVSPMAHRSPRPRQSHRLNRHQPGAWSPADPGRAVARATR